MKKALPVILIIVLLACIGLVWIQAKNPMGEINRAFKKADYETVVGKYEKLSSDVSKKYVEDRLSEIAEEQYTSYFNKELSYEEVWSFYELITEKVLANKESILKKKENILILKESRENFEKGLENKKTGKYLEAISYFERVSALDEENKKDAENYIHECAGTYCNLMISEADRLIAAGRYEDARNIVGDALIFLPDNTLLIKKLEQIDKFLNINITAKYTTTYNLGKLLAAELGLGDRNIYFPVELIFDFSDTTIRMYIVKESIKPAIEALTDDSESMKAMYEVAKNYGIGKTEADILIGLLYGGSYSKFILDRFKTEINDALKDFSLKTIYFADESKIYLGSSAKNDKEYISYETSGELLKFLAYKGNDSNLKLLEYPLYLEQKTLD